MILVDGWVSHFPFMLGKSNLVCKRVGFVDVERKYLNYFSGPPYVHPIPDMKAVVGKEFMVICPAGGYPIDTITWTKGKRRFWPLNLIAISKSKLETVTLNASCFCSRIATTCLPCFLKFPPFRKIVGDMRRLLALTPFLSPTLSQNGFMSF